MQQDSSAAQDSQRSFISLKLISRRHFRPAITYRQYLSTGKAKVCYFKIEMLHFLR